MSVGTIKLRQRKGEIVTFEELLQNGVICLLHAKNRTDAIHQLVSALDKEGKLRDGEQFYQAILKREQLVSTGIGMGVAIPHAKLSVYRHFFIAIGIQQTVQGIEWNSLDGVPVKLVFLVGGPENRQTEYLKILSRLTSLVKTMNLHKRLIKARSYEDIIQFFKKEEPCF